jgi:hypothetical protein
LGKNRVDIEARIADSASMKTKIKETTASNPEKFAQALVCARSVEKGISASASEVVGDVPGTWAVLAEGIAVTIRPNPGSSIANDRLKTRRFV